MDIKERHEQWKIKMQELYMPSIYLDKILNWTYDEKLAHIVDCVDKMISVWDSVPFNKLCKKRGTNFVFVTLNFDENKISKGTPLQIVQKIVSWESVNRYAYAFEWRDHEKETGLHAHLILVGNCGSIMKNCKRAKGPYIKLCKEYGTLLKYPMKFLSDKVKYINGETFEESKTAKKELDENLRIKNNLLSVNNL